MANVPTGIVIFPKISIAGVGCTTARTLQTTDRQTTDGRTMTYSEVHRRCKFGKN